MCFIPVSPLYGFTISPIHPSLQYAVKRFHVHPLVDCILKYRILSVTAGKVNGTMFDIFRSEIIHNLQFPWLV